jgi:hypothetical protein
MGKMVMVSNTLLYPPDGLSFSKPVNGMMGIGYIK